MLPNTDAIEEDDLLDEDMEEEVIPDRTYKLNFDTKTIAGMVDGDDAKKQCINKQILTEQEDYPIYGLLYGTMLDDLIGEDITYAQCEAKSRIEEAILNDDRFESVEFTEQTIDKNKLILAITVTTSEGDEIDMEGVEVDV